MMAHSKEPWPPFTEVCEPATPHPESAAIARLSWDDYIRARACVNACAGYSDAEVSHGLVPATRHSTVAHQRDQLLAALSGLVDDIQGLMSESDGVAGLHLNGDVAPWSELEAGSRYERLTHLPDAVAAIAAEKAEPAPSQEPPVLAGYGKIAIGGHSGHGGGLA
ncbi:hypothetical protein DK842_17795 [Chromobacterium phragmitis]|uniref:hypothetical protein n=1 Tax=Chromobacterium phragmitis TaxID=2202141 RepID=UPI000DED01AB|nr:hypothetical protein [Chromobacterium phragmitis]AXE31589.1 hypothetical protein DK842_17795 [Chromobacterium phragmitis]